VRAAVLGEKPVRKVFSKEQRALYAAHAPEGLELEDLAILGPITVLKLKFAPGTGSSASSSPSSGSIPTTRCSSSCRPSAPLRGVPGRSRGESLPGAARHRPLGRAGDEDEEGTRVLLEAASGTDVTVVADLASVGHCPRQSSMGRNP
jgi:hypothetical protein